MLQGECGSGSYEGQGDRDITKGKVPTPSPPLSGSVGPLQLKARCGFELQWTDTPTQWSNDFRSEHAYGWRGEGLNSFEFINLNVGENTS